MQLDPCSIPLPPSPTLTVVSLATDLEELPAESSTYPTSPTLNMAAPAETTSNEIGNTIKLLEHHNYHQWSDMRQLYFLVHNLDGIVDGSESQPTGTAAETASWLL